jgi:hypothetical protein
MLAAGLTPQHNGVPAHLSITVHEILNEPYLGWLIVDHGSPSSSVPLSWPPCSPDLTTLDKSLWGLLHTMKRSAELWDRHSQILCHRCFCAWWYMSLCFEHDGAHVVLLDVTWYVK